MKSPRPLLFLASVALAAAAAGRDTLRMDLQNTFSGPAGGSNAVTVSLWNDGPSVRGTLRVVNGANGATYPVDLPQGARKDVLTLNGESDGRQLLFVFDTGREQVTQWMTPTFNDRPTGGTALLVGDDHSGLSFLRDKTTEAKRSVQGGDAYVSPEEAPARPAAYATFDAVVVAPGAERIDDGTVAALREYALGGGTLVFLGGRQSVVLDDARWADVLPAKGWRNRTAQSQALSDLGDAPIEGTFEVIEPKSLAPGGFWSKSSSLGSTFEYERGLGLGRVVVLGYSVLDKPLDEWSGRPQAFAHLVRVGEPRRAHQFLDTYLNQTVMRSGDSSTLGYPDGAPSNPTRVDDPFSTKLPPAGSVFGLLAGYFVLVVPASFLVLRKLKRGEWAWVTAPLLSLGFAGALFRSADGLYAAKLSTASQGVLVMQEGVPGATFYGTSQMFFPKGGTYDLKLQGVDRLEAVEDEGYFGSNALAGFNAVDDGRIEVPSLEASNLAFREMSYSQHLDETGAFLIRRIDADHTRVENRSPFAFNGTLMSGKRGSAVFQLAPGAAKVIEDGAPQFSRTSDGWDPTSPHNFTDQGGRLALTGTLTGLRPGPQIGDEVRNSVSVIAFAAETTGKETTE